MEVGTHFTCLSQDEKEYVLEHYCEKGETAREVAEWIGCSTTTVYRLAARIGKQKMKYWSAEDVELVRKNYDGTKDSVNRIGEMLSVEPRKVMAAIIRYKI